MKKLFHPDTIQLILAVLLVLIFCGNLFFSQKTDVEKLPVKEIKSEFAASS